MDDNLVSELTAVDNKFECTSSKVELVPINQDVAELPATMAPEFFKDVNDVSKPGTWIGALVLEGNAATDFAAVDLVQLLKFESRFRFSVDSSLFAEFTLDNGRMTTPISLGDSPFGLDLEDSSPNLFFGQFLLESGRVSVFSCLVFRNAGPTGGTDCARLIRSPFNLFGEMILKIARQLSFQALKFFSI